MRKKSFKDANLRVYQSGKTPRSLKLSPPQQAPPNPPEAYSEGGSKSKYRYHPRIQANMSGATMEASDSMMNFGVSTPSFPHVIFSLGTAPEYEPKLVVESEI